MGFLLFLLVYIAGGVSFLVAAAAVAVFFLTDQVPEVSADLQSRHDAGDNKIFKTTDEKTLQKIKHEPDVAAGYFAVTREFVPGGINGKPPERASPIGIPARPEDGPTSMYQTMVRSIFDRRPAAGTGPKRAGNVFYVVLRYGLGSSFMVCLIGGD